MSAVRNFKVISDKFNVLKLYISVIRSEKDDEIITFTSSAYLAHLEFYLMTHLVSR
jgi:hypothetical protein